MDQEITVKLLLKPEEAAEALAISRTAVYDLLGSGVLESVQIGRSRRVPVEALASYVEALRSERMPASAGQS